ncbi:MAG: nucleotidyltransferase domain-containing protein [Thermoguttaceae bacterium]
MPPELTAIRDAILAVVSAEKIYLFGSHARGDQRPDSDYDIYIVLPDDGISEAEATEQVYSSLIERTEYLRPVDIVANYVSRFAQRKTRPTIERVIVNEGVVLYEKK